MLSASRVRRSGAIDRKTIHQTRVKPTLPEIVAQVECEDGTGKVQRWHLLRKKRKEMVFLLPLERLKQDTGKAQKRYSLERSMKALAKNTN